jgi:hypothetical protein
MAKKKALKHTQAKNPSDKVRRTRELKKERVRYPTLSRNARAINPALKGLLQAVEPPKDADKNHLDGTFRAKLDAVLADLSGKGTPFKFVEGFRTVDRQQWLYGSGRPEATPYGRPGPIVTNLDGVNKVSNHQGTGTIGTGMAADCYPLKDGKVYIPPSSDPVWETYADAVEAQGLKAGHHFKTFKDSPHCELTAAPLTSIPSELHALGSLSIPDLDLVDYAEAAAEKLQADFSAVVFTSGRRNTQQQADAMSGNVVQNRKWIEQTYVPSPERDELQNWVDSNPNVNTKQLISTGLVSIMIAWSDDKKRSLSRHFSGQAFDVQPVAGAAGDSIKTAIKALPNLRKFLDNEGGLIIWHADFEKV